jgi:DNA invertase Pin-like site-specific DNA recombinase
MQRRTLVYISERACSAGTSSELAERLRHAVADRGDVVVGTFSDDDAGGRRRHRSSAWRAVLASLDGVDVVVVASAADLPGRTVADLLRLLGTLRDHGVGLFLLTEGIDTASGSAALLDLISAYRAAKLSEAIRRGQDRARAAGKSIGRPAIPQAVLISIQVCLQRGGGIRPTARSFNVSPASVVTIKRSMVATIAQAA